MFNTSNTCQHDSALQSEETAIWYTKPRNAARRHNDNRMHCYISNTMQQFFELKVFMNSMCDFWPCEFSLDACYVL